MTGHDLVIRSAGLDDAAAIAAIYAHHVAHGTATFDTVPRTVAETSDKIAHHIARGWPFLVAERDRDVIGYAYVSQFRDRPAYRFACEDSIYIAPGHQGQGVGRMLLDALIADATRHGFRQMLAVAGGGEPASVALHASAGFVVAGRMQSIGHKFGQWLDTVYMQRALGPGDSVPPQDRAG